MSATTKVNNRTQWFIWVLVAATPFLAKMVLWGWWGVGAWVVLMCLFDFQGGTFITLVAIFIKLLGFNLVVLIAILILAVVVIIAIIKETKEKK